MPFKVLNLHDYMTDVKATCAAEQWTISVKSNIKVRVLSLRF